MEPTLNDLYTKADKVEVSGNVATATFGADQISVKVLDDTRLDLQRQRSSQHRRLLEYLR